MLPRRVGTVIGINLVARFAAAVVSFVLALLDVVATGTLGIPGLRVDFHSGWRAMIRTAPSPAAHRPDEGVSKPSVEERPVGRRTGVDDTLDI